MNSGMLRSVARALLFAAVLASAGCSCERTEDSPPNASTPQRDTLEPLVLRDDTPSLLLTWIDDQGDFHVVQKIADVPVEARREVRVVQTTREAGTGQLVYVADLTAPTADGSYVVHSRTRAQWDELGAARRQARLEALAPGAARSAAPSSPSAAPGELVVAVYGADWCKPCRDVERYLQQRGVKVDHKDVDKDALARAELDRKLRAAHLPATAQIPIIDVAGRLLVGFSPSALDAALKSARAVQKL